jgi:hypothetical protein
MTITGLQERPPTKARREYGGQWPRPVSMRSTASGMSKKQRSSHLRPIKFRRNQGSFIPPPSRVPLSPATGLGSGVFETVVAVLLLIPKTARLGAGLIVVWMTAVILSHIFVLGYSPGLSRAPLGLDPGLLLQTVECRVQGPLLDLESFL